MFVGPIMTAPSDWFAWALLSAVFAALTAIFAKIGLEGIDADLATLVRTGVIIIALAGFVYATGKLSNPFALRAKTWLFLVLFGLATGASWVCYLGFQEHLPENVRLDGMTDWFIVPSAVKTAA
jgi:transporter family protein